jgi:hypothetical protein
LIRRLSIVRRERQGAELDGRLDKAFVAHGQATSGYDQPGWALYGCRGIGDGRQA